MTNGRGRSTLWRPRVLFNVVVIFGGALGSPSMSPPDSFEIGRDGEAPVP